MVSRFSLPNLSGIFDAEPVLPWVLKPDLKITLTEGVPKEIAITRMNSVQEAKKEEDETSSETSDIENAPPVLIDFTPPSSPTQRRRMAMSQIISKEDIKVARNASKNRASNGKKELVPYIVVLLMLRTSRKKSEVITLLSL